MNAQNNPPSFDNQVLQINAGLHVLRQLLSRSVPSDFGWAFMVTDYGEVVISFNWVHDSIWQQEVRGETVADVLAKFRRINWGYQRGMARLTSLGDQPSFGGQTGGRS